MKPIIYVIGILSQQLSSHALVARVKTMELVMTSVSSTTAHVLGATRDITAKKVHYNL